MQGESGISLAAIRQLIKVRHLLAVLCFLSQYLLLLFNAFIKIFLFHYHLKFTMFSNEKNFYHYSIIPVYNLKIRLKLFNHSPTSSTSYLIAICELIYYKYSTLYHHYLTYHPFPNSIHPHK